jgi:peptidoglycan hydrolase CwlO-like protein
MKINYYLLAAVLVISIAGCNRDKDTNTEPPVTGQDVKDKYKDALKTTGDYTAQTKDQFMADTDKKMKELNARIDDLSNKSANLKDDAKVQADKALAALRADRDAAAKKYDELKQSSGDAWDKTKAAFQSAWNDVEKAYDDAKAKFNPTTNSANPNP